MKEKIPSFQPALRNQFSSSCLAGAVGFPPFPVLTFFLLPVCRVRREIQALQPCGFCKEMLQSFMDAYILWILSCAIEERRKNAILEKRSFVK